MPKRTFLSETLTAQTDVRIMRSERGDSIVRQTCPDGQFWLVAQGSWHFKEEGATRLLGTMDFAYSAPGEPCVRTAERDVVAFGIQIRGQLLSRWEESKRWTQPITSIPWEFKSAYVRLMNGYLSGRLQGDELEDAAVNLLTQTSASQSTGRKPSWLITTQQILQDDAPENQTLSSLASAVGITPAHLSATFRAVFGTTLTEAKRRIRLERAFRLAGDGQTPLNEAAIAAGFYDASHFHRTCIAELGMTPRAVLNLLKAEKKSGKIENLYKTAA